jgi:HSP20 family protein
VRQRELQISNHWNFFVLCGTSEAMTKNLLSQWGQIQRKLAGLSGELAADREAAGWQPNTDVYDGPDGLVVKVELAGVPCDGLSVFLEQSALIIEGVRRDPYTGETGAGYRFRQMEIEYGPFRRIIPLPYPVNGKGALAHCQGGILEIRLPRAAAPVARRVTIILQA